MLGPIQKYNIYGVFPTKYLVHIIAVILSSILAIDQNMTNANIYKPQYDVFYNKLFKIDDDYWESDFQGNYEYGKIKEFYTVQDMN